MGNDLLADSSGCHALVLPVVAPIEQVAVVTLLIANVRWPQPLMHGTSSGWFGFIILHPVFVVVLQQVLPLFMRHPPEGEVLLEVSSIPLGYVMPEIGESQNPSVAVPPRNLPSMYFATFWMSLMGPSQPYRDFMSVLTTFGDSSGVPLSVYRRSCAGRLRHQCG